MNKVPEVYALIQDSIADFMDNGWENVSCKIKEIRDNDFWKLWKGGHENDYYGQLDIDEHICLYKDNIRNIWFMVMFKDECK